MSCFFKIAVIYSENWYHCTSLYFRMFVFISLFAKKKKKEKRLLIKRESTLAVKEISFHPREMVCMSDFLLSNFRLLDIFIMGGDF